MNVIEQFANVAIMLIYPNGLIDKLFIDDKNLLHMRYFVKLLEVSPDFAAFVHENKIQLTNKKGELLAISTYYLDMDLTALGVIVIRNNNILEIKKDKSFLQTVDKVNGLFFFKNLYYNEYARKNFYFNQKKYSTSRFSYAKML